MSDHLCWILFKDYNLSNTTRIKLVCQIFFAILVDILSHMCGSRMNKKFQKKKKSEPSIVSINQIACQSFSGYIAWF